MASWYGPPIAIAGVPGNVWVHKGGDFRGRIASGQFLSAVDFGLGRMKRIVRNVNRRSRYQCNVGFSSLSELIAEMSAGKKRDFSFQKVGSTGVVGVTNSLWRAGNFPPSGAAGSAAPGGRACSSATTGAFPFTNPTGGDTQHFICAFGLANFANSLLLYDRLFDVAKTMNSTATESVTGVPTRYQGSVGAADSPEGNFAFVEVGGTALAATAHNWTVCRYRNQAGTDAQSFPSLTGNSGAIVDRLDHPVMQWFMRLNGSDTGVMDLDQMQCSALVATGLVNFVVGHPIAFIPIPLVNLVCTVDGINTALNLTRIFDDACLAFLEVCKPATSATTYNGSFTTAWS
jgi:hypothetical protein